MEKTFIRVHSAKDIVISVSLIIVGSILIALPTGAKLLEQVRLGVLCGSVISAVLGCILLNKNLPE